MPRAFAQMQRVFLQIRTIIRCLLALRIPLFISLITITALAVPDQSQDIYRIYGSSPLQYLAQISLGTLSLTALTFTLHHACIWSAHCSWKYDRQLTREFSTVIAPLSGVISISPWIGIALGAWLALPTKVIVPDLMVLDQRRFALPALALFTITCLALIGSLLLFYECYRRNRRLGFLIWTYTHFRNPSVGPTYLLPIAVLAAFLISPVSVPQLFGPVFLLTGFFAVLLYLICALSRVSLLYKFPIIGVILAIAAAAAILDINDNHRVRVLTSAPKDDSFLSRKLGIIPMSVEFLRWLASRKDIEHFTKTGKPYPIYVIAARGGGVYAAYHAAMTLARIQDHCPSFSQHIFAISGVSGGSLGAAVFAKLAERFASNAEYKKCVLDDPVDTVVQDRTRAILGQDFLSPILARGLSFDFAQNFLPLPIYGLDRSIPMERSFELAWDSAVPERRGSFSEPFFRGWNAKGAAPALLFNTTDVDTGKRIVFSPFGLNFLDGELESAIDRAGIGLEREGDMQRDFRLSTVVGLSARFPWIAPAGWVDSYRLANNGDGLIRRKVRLLDGGIFENSGVETAFDVKGVIDKLAHPESIKERDMRSYNGALAEYREREGQDYSKPALQIVVKLITFTDTDYRYWKDGVYQGLAELFAPIKALLASRVQRGELALARTLNEYHCPHCYTRNLGKHEVRQFQLSVVDYKVPLGWMLSKELQRYIETQIGDFAGCDVGERPKRQGFLSMYDRAVEANACETYLVAQDLAFERTSPGSARTK